MELPHELVLGKSVHVSGEGMHCTIVIYLTLKICTYIYIQNLNRNASKLPKTTADDLHHAPNGPSL